MAALQGVIRCYGSPVISKSSFTTVCPDARVGCVCRVVMNACDSGGLQQVEEYVKLEMSPLKIIVT